MVKVIVNNNTYVFSPSDFKLKFRVLYELNLVEQSEEDDVVINFDENPHRIITPWAFEKYIELLKLIDAHLTPLPEKDDLVFLHRFNPDVDTSELSFNLPEFHSSLDGDRFVVGLDSSFGDFFYKLESDLKGPDGRSRRRGLNLGSLTKAVEFIGWFLPLNLCCARLAQHKHRQNSSRKGYACAKIGAILLPKNKKEEEAPKIKTKRKRPVTQKPKTKRKKNN